MHEVVKNREPMYMEGDTAHRILFLDANSDDGILVEAEKESLDMGGISM